MVLFGAGRETEGERPDDTEDSDVVAGDRTTEQLPVLAGLGMPTVVLDPDGRITRCNDHALSLFDVEGESAVGVEPEQLLDGGSDVSPVGVEAIEAGEAIEDREEKFVVNGELRHVSRTVRPVYDDGRCVGAVEIDRDIGARIERRERTEALERYQRRVLTDLQENLDRLGDGDLTIDVGIEPPREEFAEVQAVYEEFSRMNEDLDRVVTNFTTIVETLTAQADEIAGSSDTLSAASEEVTASIQQIDASADEMATGAERLAGETETADRTVEDLSASIEEITATTQQINARSTNATELADDGVDTIRGALGEIRDATDAAGTVAEDMDELESQMAEVGEIVKIISDIADQTNILALNANIEAARAGNGGEGFAVVAEEVKTLAGNSRDSADDIVRIIDDAQGMTEQLVESIQNANARVSTGADAVDDAADTLEVIRRKIDETNDGVTEIADAVESQAHDAEQVSGVVDDTASMAQQVSAAVEEIAAGIDEQAQAMDQVAHRAEYLSTAGDNIHELVDLFKLDESESATVDDVENLTDQQVETGQATVAGDSTDAVVTEASGDSSGEGPARLGPEDF